jgi:hypothetical protein
MHNHNPNHPYLPSRRQIQRSCRSIQSTWSEHQRREREVGANREVQVPLYSVSSLGVDLLDFEQDELETLIARS